MSACKFYVNEAERTIVCVIPNTEYMLNDFISEHFSFRDCDIEEAMYMSRGSYRMPKSFMGKAVCSKDDEWDEELGKMIAFSRAKDKCYKSFFRRASTLINTFDGRLGDMIMTFNAMGAKLDAKRSQLENMIEERTQK